MRDVEYELKTAVYTALSANITDYPVINGMVQDMTYPHIRIGEWEELGEWSEKNSPGVEGILTIHFWDKNTTSKVVSDMKDQVKQNIGLSNDETTNHLSMSNFLIVGCLLADNGFSREVFENGIYLRHSIINLRYYIQESRGD